MCLPRADRANRRIVPSGCGHSHCRLKRYRPHASAAYPALQLLSLAEDPCERPPSLLVCTTLDREKRNYPEKKPNQHKDHLAYADPGFL